MGAKTCVFYRVFVCIHDWTYFLRGPRAGTQERTHKSAAKKTRTFSLEKTVFFFVSASWCSNCMCFVVFSDDCSKRRAFSRNFRLACGKSLVFYRIFRFVCCKTDVFYRIFGFACHKKYDKTRDFCNKWSKNVIKHGFFGLVVRKSTYFYVCFGFPQQENT